MAHHHHRARLQTQAPASHGDRHADGHAEPNAPITLAAPSKPSDVDWDKKNPSKTNPSKAHTNGKSLVDPVQQDDADEIDLLEDEFNFDETPVVAPPRKPKAKRAAKTSAMDTLLARTTESVKLSGSNITASPSVPAGSASPSVPAGSAVLTPITKINDSVARGVGIVSVGDLLNSLDHKGAPAKQAPAKPKAPAKRASASPSASTFLSPKPKAPSILDEIPDDIPDDIPPKAEKKKKKPGRPKKEIRKISVPHQGIVARPSNYEQAADTDEIYVFELIHDNPVLFKKIFQACKSVGVEIVRLKFLSNELIIYGENPRTHETRIHAKVYGARVSLYYCGEPGLEIGVELDVIIRIVSTINNENSKIHINTKLRHERSRIRIASSNDQSYMLSQFQANVSPLTEYDWDIDEVIRDEAEYPINFEMTFKDFKKIISDAKACEGEIIHIEKEQDSPLRFSYVFSDNKGRGDIHLGNDELIKLRCDIGGMEVFASAIYTDYLKAFSATQIADNLEFSADLNRPLILTAYLDHLKEDEKKIIPGTERCVLKVIVNLVKGVSG